MITMTDRQRILLESKIYPEQIVRYQDRPIQRIGSIDSAGIYRLTQGDLRLKWLTSQLWCPRGRACPATWCRFALRSRPHGCLLANALNSVSFFFFFLAKLVSMESTYRTSSHPDRRSWWPVSGSSFRLHSDGAGVQMHHSTAAGPEQGRRFCEGHVAKSWSSQRQSAWKS